MAGLNIIIEGRIDSGEGRGRKMGVPTLNVFYKGPIRGVYVCDLEFKDRSAGGGEVYRAVANVGARPTFGIKEVACELHVLVDSAKVPSTVLSGQIVKVFLRQKIRNIKKFPNKEELVRQIQKDIEIAKKYG